MVRYEVCHLKKVHFLIYPMHQVKYLVWWCRGFLLLHLYGTDNALDLVWCYYQNGQFVL